MDSVDSNTNIIDSSFDQEHTPITPAYVPYREESMPLISFNNETQKFEVNEEVKIMLNNLKGPIGVVAVAGQYRTGKSYLLNRMLLNRSQGFGVGPSINPCTKGLWVWGTPISGTTADGQHINVLVVDSEGIGGLDEDNNHDMRIFSLALLLSSYFLYNSVGSIDENALSNLSLVTNISKHIQFKSGQTASGEDLSSEDLEDLISCMPSFMWVVRDFALQLCDEEGSEINSKEYLERALQEKGQADSKNEIRKHLKKFFHHRECSTIIRPLTNEEELQNLEVMDLEELRAEFVEQVMTLRKKVLHQIKPKTIQNQQLDGAQWISMVELYVKAMNDGSVPNIQSSWSYICRQSAQKQIALLKQQLNSEIQESLHFPMNHEDLIQYFNEQRSEFQKKLDRNIGQSCDIEIKNECQSDFNAFFQSLEQTTLFTNLSHCRQYSQDLLSQLFSEFDLQLKQQQSFDSAMIDQTMSEVCMVYDQNCVDFTEKQQLLTEAKANFFQETLFYVTRKINQENEMQRQIDQQTRERLEQQLSEAKNEARNERAQVEDRLKQALTERSDFEAQAIFLKEQLDQLKLQKAQDEQDMKEQIRKAREESSQASDEYRLQRDDIEEKMSAVVRQMIQVQSEFEKEKALFEQKIDFLERSLEEKSTKEKEYLAERQSQKQGVSSEIKTLCLKYESDLKTLQQSLKEEEERVQELETVIKEKELLMSEKQEQWLSQEQTLRTSLQSSQDFQKSLEQSLSLLRRETESRLSTHSKEKEGRAEQYLAQIQELESQLKECQELSKNKEHEFKKESAIRDQKLEFLEMHLQDCKDQLEESHRQHEQMVRAMKDDMQHEEDQARRKNISPSKVEAMQSEMLRREEEQERVIKQLSDQLENANEKNNDLELSLKLVQQDISRLNQSHSAQLAELESQKAQLQDKLKTLEAQRQKMMEEQEKKYKDMVLQMEEEIEERGQIGQREVKEMQEKSEEALAQLRNFYEFEKEKLEQRIQEERDKNQRRLQHFQEEVELRMRDEMQDKEEELEALHNELQESDGRHQQYVTQMEHELSLKQQMMETMERQIREVKERNEIIEYGKNSAFEKQIEHFEQQRQEYNLKIDRLLAENLDKDRQLAQLQHKQERLTEEIDRKKDEIEGYKNAMEKEKRLVQDKMENTKRKLAEAQDEAMRQKLEFGREQALMKQQVEFQQKKIDELQKQQDDSQRNFDDKIKLFKSDLLDESQSQIERITSEKELWENKYEQKRRALKEIEMSLSKNNNELEKKLINLQAVVERQEEDKRIMEEQYQDEIQSLSLQIQQLDSNAGAAYYYGSAHAEDVLKLKQQLQDLEREMSDLQSTYDRDKALWEGKCQFLETQKETYKRDLIESQKKFEITLEQLQKRGNNEKDKFENNQNSLIKVIESKYKNQIKEMLDTHQQMQGETQSKIKRLENEIKVLNEKLQLEARGKHQDYSLMEKRCADLADQEKRLQQELDEIRHERDRRIGEYQRQMDKDKEVYRAKMAEYEQKSKDSESRRASLMFEYEKERAKWQLERDNLLVQKSDMSETIDKLQSRKDQLLRENEKLRTESKGSRKYLLGNSTNIQPQSVVSQHSSTSATRYMVGKSMSNGGNVLSQAINKMKENKQFIGGPQQQQTQMNNQYYGGNPMKDLEEGTNKNTTPNSKHYNRYAGN